VTSDFGAVAQFKQQAVFPDYSFLSQCCLLPCASIRETDLAEK